MTTRKFMIEMHVDGSYTVEVEAADLEEAKAKADELYNAADFGVLENIDREFSWYRTDGGDSHDLL